jgi:FkbM family methyltransferase
MSPRSPAILHRIWEKIRIGWRMTQLYRNWPMAFLDWLHLIRPRPIVYRLRDGTELCASTRTYDLYIINEVWLDDVYTSSLGFSIRDGWVIVDIGGHKGIFSIFAATRARNVMVYTFEPAPANFAQLSYNIQQNKLSNVRMFNIAVSGRDGESTLHLYPDCAQSGFLQRSNPALRPVRDIKVETWSMERVLRTIASPVNLLKMDIEGTEYEALLSCPADILQTVERIVLEYHDDRVRTSHSVSELVERLNDRGFSTHLHPSRQMLFAERQQGNSYKKRRSDGDADCYG